MWGVNVNCVMNLKLQGPGRQKRETLKQMPCQYRPCSPISEPVGGRRDGYLRTLTRKYKPLILLERRHQKAAIMNIL